MCYGSLWQTHNPPKQLHFKYDPWVCGKTIPRQKSEIKDQDDS